MAGLLMDHPDGFFDWLGQIPPLTSLLLGFIANRFALESTAALIYRLSGKGQAAATVSGETARSLAPLVVRRALRRVKGEA